jgi:hypothetical protein
MISVAIERVLDRDVLPPACNELSVSFDLEHKVDSEDYWKMSALWGCGVKFLHRAKNVAAPDGYGFFSPPSCRRQIEAWAPWLGIE